MSEVPLYCVTGADTSDSRPGRLSSRFMAHTRQLKPDSGLGLQAKVRKTFQGSQGIFEGEVVRTFGCKPRAARRGSSTSRELARRTYHTSRCPLFVRERARTCPE